MHNRWHPDLEPIAEVAPGEEIRLETADGLDGQLTRESTHADAATLDLGLGHPLTRPGLRDRRAARRPARGRAAPLRDRRLRHHRGHPRLRLPRRPLHRAVPGQVGDRRRTRPLGGAARRGGARGRLRRRDRRRAVARAARGHPAARGGAGRERGAAGRRLDAGGRRTAGGGGGAADDPTARARRQPGHPPARRRQPPLAAGGRARARCSRSATCTSPRATARSAGRRSRSRARSRCASA